MSAASQLDALGKAHPEWTGWLQVLRQVVGELSDPAWETGWDSPDPASDLSPMLAGAVLRPDGHALAQLLDRLTSVARAQGLHALAGKAKQGRKTSADAALRVFLAAVNGDQAALDLQAAQQEATPEGWRSITQLLPMPYLHACARRWAAQPQAPWSHGYCPVCGAWPAFAELRGVERARHLRCGRCGAGWPKPVLVCTYCATIDHETLGTLVVDGNTSRFALDVCRGCSGYLKTCTTLQPTPSDEVLAIDLASVAFDLVAVDRGFLRPSAPGVALGASLAYTATVPPVVPSLAQRWWS